MIAGRCWLLAAVATIPAMVACQSDPPPVDTDADVDPALVEALRRQPIDQAIIAQHTLFPYHFVANSSYLNELGQRDLGVLAEHLAANPGPLNVRRGSESDKLYQARAATVVQYLQGVGVPRDRLQVDKKLPGGDGMPSEWVLMILKDSQSSSRSRTGSGGSSSGGGMGLR